MVAVTLILGCSSERIGSKPRNVILLIGDGMGPGQVEAAGWYEFGLKYRTGGADRDGIEPGEEALSFEPYHKGEVITSSLDPGKVTDSAAAATAMATGHKVKRQVLGLDPDGTSYPTMLELFARRGKATGLVTTITIVNATPAAFAAHQPDRYMYNEVAHDFLTGSRPNVLMGAVLQAKGISEHPVAIGRGAYSAKAAGYDVVTTLDEMNAFVRRAEAARLQDSDLHLCGELTIGSSMPFEYDRLEAEADLDPRAVDYRETPHLSEMTAAALELLDNDRDGFFLMVEGGTIDTACHSGQLERAVMETVEFSKAVQVVLDWVKGRSDTLVIITADHETGGLTPLANNGVGVFPEVVWLSKNHTGTRVPIYALGPGSERIQGVLQNTDIFYIMTGMPVRRPPVARTVAEPARATEQSEPVPSMPAD